MEVKKDILWRVYLCYIAVVCLCLLILGKAFFIQQIQGQQWRNTSDSLHLRIVETVPERGTIYSEDGEMLSTSIPQFDIYIDFLADGLRNKSGKLFRKHVDSLSIGLSSLFKDVSAAEYKRMLQQGYKSKDRYFLLKKNIGFRQYQQLMTLPLVRLGRNNSGFITEVKSIRLNPYKLLAFRTIGLDRQFAQKIGLEQTYDTFLRGTSGKRLVRFIAGGACVPVEDYQIEPENGKDIITTIDVFTQEVAENALMKMMIQNEAEHGCAIVMETKTGKVKAVANLGRSADGSYYEDFNYAINPSEPGSTFKLATLMALLDDKKVNLNSIVNLNGGVWQVNGQTVFDSEKHGRANVTVQQAFELSSNVGMAKLAYAHYYNRPTDFINRLHEMRMDTLTGIDITGERNATIPKPGGRSWSKISPLWMAFGYNLQVTPLQTAVLYNAIANGGKMMKPYLVSAIANEGMVVKQYEPQVLKEQICSEATLPQLKMCLEGVCINGTARELFKNSPYKVAGKTGTALVANGSRGYVDHIYQSSFAGYFPANNPQYTCVVVIKNKPSALVFYGASVAGPVFKEIADRLYATEVSQASTVAVAKPLKVDSIAVKYTGNKRDLSYVFKNVSKNYFDIGGVNTEWASATATPDKIQLEDKLFERNQTPQLIGLNLKDAIYLCESVGLKVRIKGKGRVKQQSITAGQIFAKGQLINLELN